MKIVPTRLAVSLFAAFVALPAVAQTVATVNGTAIPQARADLLIAEQKAQGAPDSDQLRTAVKDRLIGLEVVAQEPARRGSRKMPPPRPSSTWPASPSSRPPTSRNT